MEGENVKFVSDDEEDEDSESNSAEDDKGDDESGDRESDANYSSGRDRPGRRGRKGGSKDHEMSFSGSSSSSDSSSDDQGSDFDRRVGAPRIVEEQKIEFKEPFSSNSAPRKKSQLD